MYMFTATGQGAFKDLKGKNIVEIGSGRGGGLEYVHRTMHSAKAIGVDFSDNQVQFCQQSYANVPDLSFIQGDGEKLDRIDMLKELQADLVINVESSHCYGNFHEFVSQVSRILKPGGHFSITDFRGEEDLEIFEKSLTSHGLKLVSKTDITPNILASL